MAHSMPPTDLAHPVRRELGLPSCIAMVVGNMIGMGIFLIPASLAPYRLNALIGWAVTIIGCVALSLIFSRLAKVHPEADGPYAYIKAELGPAPAHVVMTIFWFGAFATEAALATGVVGYLVEVVPSLASIPAPLVALALLWVITASNSFGVKTGGRTQIFSTVLKLVPLLLVIAIGVVTVTHEPYGSAWSVPHTEIGAVPIMTSVTITLYAMLGIESASIPALRVKNPSVNIPLATMIGTLFVALVYIGVSVVPMLLIPTPELAASSSPLSIVVRRFTGDNVSRWIDLFVVVSGLGALNGWALINAEATRTMADNNVLPKVFGHINRFGSPGAGLVINSALASLLVLMSYNKTMVEAFTFYTKIVSAGELPMYFCVAAAIAVLWWRGELRRGSAVTLAAVTIAFLFVFVAFAGAGTLADVALVILAVGSFVLFRLKHRKTVRP